MVVFNGAYCNVLYKKVTKLCRSGVAIDPAPLVSQGY